MLTAEEIAANIAGVRQRIAEACARAGRNPADVTLVAVSKTFPAEAVEMALRAGITHVGENRVQEAASKRPSVVAEARWHLIGHLQSNKTREAVRVFDAIETIDSTALAQRVARHAAEAGKVLDVFVQVNIGREPQKSGADPDETGEIVDGLAKLDSLRLAGLMAIPPQGESRPHFRNLRLLADSLGVRGLSMGMSADYEVAIEEGATLVRVGSAIFGAR